VVVRPRSALARRSGPSGSLQVAYSGATLFLS
jgi:hypothetical protein